jgi:hypothetical protein
VFFSSQQPLTKLESVLEFLAYSEARVSRVLFRLMYVHMHIVRKT